MASSTPAERRKAAARAVREARRRRGLQRDEHAERVVGSLSELQPRIRKTLADAPTEFERSHLEPLLREVSAHVQRWERRAKGLMTHALEEAWELAPELVEAPFAAVGRELQRVLLPESLLEEFVAEGVDLMSGLGTVARKRVHESIESGLLGGMNPTEVMQEIGERISDSGPMRVVAFRAESATRTEMGRVHSKAGQRRMAKAAEKLPDLEKEWVWSGKGREEHRAAAGQRRPVEKPFAVGGEELMYPRDPSASADNTILCGCESVPWMANW